MAYGHRRRSYRRSTRRTRKKSMVPVPRKKVQFKRRTAMATNRNTVAIARMKKALHGPVQKNIQNSRYQGNAIGFTPTNNRPICLDLTDFTSSTTIAPAQPTGARAFQFNAAGALAVVGGWSKQNFDLNPYFLGQNSDVAGDTGSYLPLSVHLTAKIWGGPTLIRNTRVRLDLVSLKAQNLNLQTAAFQQMTMPQGLRWMENLADPEINAISKDYFKIYATKFVSLNSRTQERYVTQQPQPPPPGPNVTDAIGSTSTTLNYRYVHFHIRPKKARHQVTTIGFSNPGATEPSEGSYGYLNVPQNEPLWLIMSTSDAALPEPLGQPEQVFIRLQRKCVWRDGVGSGSV